MTLEYFEKGLQNNNAVRISERYCIWNDYELEDNLTNKWTQYKSLEEICENRPDIKKIIDEADDFTIIDFR